MSIEQILIIILASLLVLFNILSPLIQGLIVGKYILTRQMTRKSKDEWTRKEPSDATNYEQVMMWNDGLDWEKRHREAKKEVHIVSDGNNLYGEYFDFGKDKAVIIVPGRTETLRYSYHFAKAYERNGFNVLVIDKRGHGNSDGYFEDGGEHSYVDLHEWARFLEKEYRMDNVTLHGICIGASHCVYAAAGEDRPSNIRYLVTDGMYTTFGLSFKNHMILDKRQVFPAYYFAMMWGKILLKTNFITKGPVTAIKKVSLPTLFLYSRLDKFSTPAQAEKLYALCPSQKKEIVYFDKGGHSHIYCNNEKAYEEAIGNFFARLK